MLAMIYTRDLQGYMMDKHKEHNKAKDKDTHERKDAGSKRNLDLSDADLEKKIENEKASEERRREERRKAFRRESDRVCDEKKNAVLKENQQLKEEMETLKDTMLRRQADFENYKKRIVKQQFETRKMAFRDFAHDIIQINDDLHRAIEASESIPKNGSIDDAHTSLVEGVSMISKRIEETMKKYGVVEIDALDQEFDPNFHEAVDTEISDEVEYDTVTKVYQKGFRIEDLVVRSAKVKVTKPKREVASAESATGDDEDAGGGGSVH
ncbi:MAG: nucleotide exchange factor GrpE [Spirochaetes bacterium RBG_13_51_14]|nr:MAG: nucleotide exchange factor GrpE [Spirochaetes bacterium RBG_13_51_14]